MRRPGFTIIELIITMAIGILLMSIGVPRYNAVIEKQEVGEYAYNLQQCVEAGRGLAVNPKVEPVTGIVRYGIVELQFIEDSATLKQEVACTIGGYKTAQDLSQKPNPVNQMASTVHHYESLPIGFDLRASDFMEYRPSLGEPPVSLVDNERLYLVFDSEQGARLVSIGKLNGSTYTEIKNYQSGLSFELNLRSPNQELPYQVTLSVPGSGFPIRGEIQDER